MEWNNVVWPVCTLTPEEAEFCSIYAEVGGDNPKPGVLRRIYPKRFIVSTVPGERSVTADRLQTSGRYTKVFAVTFSGDLERWLVQFTSSAGEQYVTELSPVGLLLNTASLVGTAAVPDSVVSSSVLLRAPGGPLIFDPPILLEATAVVQIATDLATQLGQEERTVLNMAFHVWELPAVPRSVQDRNRNTRAGNQQMPPSAPAQGPAGPVRNRRWR